MNTALAILALIILHPIGLQTKPAKVMDGDKAPALSKEFQAVGQLALEAIERLDEARTEESVSYEPRRLDAEKTVSDAKRRAKTTEDKHVAEVLNNFLQGLLDERHFYGGDRATDYDHWKAAIFPCAVEASWYFGETLTKEGIGIAKKSTCAPSSKPKHQ